MLDYKSEQRVLLDRNGPTRGVPVKVTTAEAFPECRSLYVGTAGTATLLDTEGNTATDFPLQAGYNPIGGIVKVTLGTASDVWAMY